MIFEKQTNANILQEGETSETLKMSLDLDSAQILMQMLSKNLYSDAVGSTIRECASNALDSHRRAGTDKPIIVSFKTGDKSDTYEFSVEDFGIGLDAEDVKNIISKYGKSTKRDSNTELGMMGLGFKAPLAYSSSFYFVARKNGMERKYMMYEGEEVNSIDLLYEKPTDQPNGVKVIVPVNYYDRPAFLTKIKEQLCYFEGVYFDIDPQLARYSDISNDFTIIRNEIFQYSSLSEKSKLHICLDNVYYPIDFQKLGIPEIHIPVGLRFTLSDGLFPTPNRESLIYTKEAKETIMNKIEAFSNYLVEKYNSTSEETPNLHSMKAYYQSKKRTLKDFPIQSRSIDLTQVLDYATAQMKAPTIPGINVDYDRMFNSLNEYVLGEYVCGYRLGGGRFMDAKSYWSKMAINDLFNYNGVPVKVYVYEDRIGGNMKSYLREINASNRDTVFFVRKPRSFKKYDKEDGEQSYNEHYDALLRFASYPQDQWDDMIVEFRKFIDYLTKDFIDLDTITIPQTWLDARKKKAQKVAISTDFRANGTKKITAKGEFCGKIGTRTENWLNDQYCKFTQNTYKLEDLYKSKGLYVYSTESNKKKMDALWSVFNPVAKFVIVADSTYKNIQKLELHNWITMEQFEKGENKPFKRMVTKMLVDDLTAKYKSVFGRINEIRNISSQLADKLEVLDKYSNYTNVSHRTDKDTKATIIEFATKNNLFDMEIYPQYIEMCRLLEKLYFLDGMISRVYGSDQSYRQAIIDLFKYHNQKVNLEHYKVKLNEDAPLDEALTESTVEELQNI